jgi:rhomboid protease GluP
MDFDYRPQPVRPPPPVRHEYDLARGAYVVYAIIAINVIAYLAVGLTGGGWMRPDPAALLRWGADFWPLTTGGQWWRLLTSAFLHFGLIHLAVNMYSLYAVGPLCEQFFGRTFFALLYVFSAVLSGLASVWWDPMVVVAGASGAIFAVFGATISYVFIHRAAFDRRAVRSLLQGAGVMVAFNVYFGLSVKGISNSAHLGGLAAGVVLGAAFARSPLRGPRQAQTPLRAALGVGLGVLAIAATIVAMPKNGHNALVINFAAEDAFEHAREAVIARQDQVAATVDELKAQAKAGELDDEALAAKVETEIVPQWDAMLRELMRAAVPAGSPSARRYDLMVAYVAARRDAYAAWAEGLKTGDDEKFKAYELLMSQGNQLAARINKLK